MENFPDEAFWWSAEATILQDGVDALLVLAMEAAFANDAVVDGDQMSFARIQIDITPTVGGTYTVTHPFGEITLPNLPAGERSRFRLEIGCDPEVTPGVCDFSAALPNDPTQAGIVNADGRSIGPFLLPSATPGGPVSPFIVNANGTFIANPNILTAVTGSPLDTNFFRVQGPGGIDITQNLFSVLGQVSGCSDLNAPPAAVDDLAVTKAETAVNIDVLANDSDLVVDVDAAGVETTRLITPAVGTVSIVAGTVTPASNGTAVVNADNTITFTPDAASTGVTTFRYTVTDFCGLVSNEATVTVFDERLIAASAEYRARTGKWLISGSSNQLVDTLDEPNVITLRAGSGTGPVIGTAAVQGDGSWSFSGKSTASPGAVPQTVHAESALGISETRNLHLR